MNRKLDQPQGRGAFFRSLGQLLGGFVAEQVEEAVTGFGPTLLRPPGALDEFAFLTACTRCDKCKEACPQDAIMKAGPRHGLALNTPFIDPRVMPCFLCTDLPCIPACPDGALVWPHLPRPEDEPLEGPPAVRMGTAKVKPSRCLTYAREEREPLECRTCVDRCPYPGLAIRIADVDDSGRIPHPEVMEAHCTGCGLCVFACPTPEPAIVVEPRR